MVNIESEVISFRLCNDGRNTRDVSLITHHVRDEALISQKSGDFFNYGL